MAASKKALKRSAYLASMEGKKFGRLTVSSVWRRESRNHSILSPLLPLLFGQ